ncbi:UNVERIFIED: hypothetical protein [Escherichia phage vB_EcoP_DE5]|uniref:Uncharacterized protein n=2 Tax=Kuravirus TaxID=680277 RepID=A0A2P1MX37_9CAUD|nr:hypothetical protein PSH2311_039 [Escherichia phage myPSH2311]AVQ10044.1 hypothetical protein PSH1131_039 [Escherichia phage myPSH1131]QKL17013.1 hypothetical protein [Escherichia phage PGN6866]
MPLPARHQNRFLVLKWDDIEMNLTEHELDLFHELLSEIRSGIPERQYVVISDKHPQEFEEAWGMKLAYIQRAIREREEVANQRVVAHLVREQPREARATHTPPPPPPWTVVNGTVRAYSDEATMLNVVEDNQAFTDLLYQ